MSRKGWATRLCGWVIRAAAILVPRHSRRDWLAEWRAELHHRDRQLSEWDRLNRQTRLNLLVRSTGAFPDALFLRLKSITGEFLQDAFFGARTLREHPAFSTVAILTLALGIGANTAAFSILRGILLRPLPFRQQERLVVGWRTDPETTNPMLELSYPEFVDLKAQTQTLENVAIMPTTVYGYGMVLTGLGEPIQLESAKVSGGFFDVLGAHPAIGHVFAPDDDQPGAPGVVVLSNALWRSRFNADPAVIGRSIVLNDKDYSVIGVMPADFSFPDGVAIWTPLAAQMSPAQLQNRGNVFLQFVGRLKPGVTARACHDETEAIFHRMSEHNEEEKPSQGIFVSRLEDHIFGNTPLILYLVVAASILVLLIACCNLANLLLARAATREKEFAIRVALGAGKERLVRQLFTESLVLALPGGALGLALASIGVRAFTNIRWAGIPRIGELHADPTMLAFAVIATLATSVIFGIAPAFVTAASDPGEALKQGGRLGSGGRGSLTRRVLVVTQVSIALVLLLAAGLTFRTLANLRGVDLGFAPHNALTMEVSLPGSKYPTAQKRREFCTALLGRLNSTPGIQAAASVLIRPLEGEIGWDWPFSVEGQSVDDARNNPVSNYESISPNYFKAMGIPFVSGRDFDNRDKTEAPRVAIVSRGFANRYWNTGDAVGRRFKLGPPDSDAPWITIIGVAADIRYRRLIDTRLDVYVPYQQSAPWTRYFIVRTEGDPAAMLPAIRAQLASVDSAQPISSIKTMDDMVAASLGRPRLTVLLMGFFAIAAAALAAIGIYGVISYSVTEREREIGIRIALGAMPKRVLTLIVKEAMTLALIGILIGTAAGLTLGRTISGLLFGVSPLDPLTYLGIAALISSVALVACVTPALRATRIDPMNALRTG